MVIQIEVKLSSITLWSFDILQIACFSASYIQHVFKISVKHSLSQGYRDAKHQRKLTIMQYLKSMNAKYNVFT